MSAVLSASLLAAIGAAPAAAATIGPDSIAGPGRPAGVTTSAVSRPYYSVEVYYLSLVNCTRTGGWVLRDGTCQGYGSGVYSPYVAPFRLSPGISNRATRPYARRLAVRDACSHNLDHDPGYRLRRAGFRSWRWGENIGCGNGFPTSRASVLDSHLRFQAEMASNGAHWQNIKSATFHYIGIGVSRYAGRTRLVADFYR